MIVYTTTGTAVSLNNSDGKSVFDTHGVEWERYPEGDCKDPYGVAYRETKSRIQVIKLSMQEIKRVINGAHAMNTPTTVEEMRDYILTLPKDYQWIADQWPDQSLREILIEAEEKHQSPAAVLESRISKQIPVKEINTQDLEDIHAESLRKAQERTEETRVMLDRYTRASRRRVQAGSLSVASGGMSVVLTPKQLEFMERLSECPGWAESGVNGEYVASQYAEELSDTMNPMAMGAVLTTLREKKILTTTKTRMGGIKCCMFKLTETGKQIYKSLAGGRDK